jgi:hypothetical protein
MGKIQNISEPSMVALVVGNASGSKLLQSFLDGHDEIISIPGYPLVYFYPHWVEWKNDLGSRHSWDLIIDLFIEKHSSIFDSRSQQGLGGLDTLGDEKNEHIQINIVEFKKVLLEYLANKNISSRTFLLGIHYAYAVCRGIDYSKIKIIIYHIHLTEYLEKYLKDDFPDVKVLGMTRKPSNNIYGRFKGSQWNVDLSKFNFTDVMIYRNRTYYNSCMVIYGEIDRIVRLNRSLDYMSIRHEDLGSNISKVMLAISKFLGIIYQDTMLEMSFDGKRWWGVSIYEKGLHNKFNNEISKDTWSDKIYNNDCRVAEGVLYDYIDLYDYTPLNYFKNDKFRDRFILLFFILMPSKPEIEILKSVMSFRNHLNFIGFAYKEIMTYIPVKDYSSSSSYRYRWCYKDYNILEKKWYKFNLSSGLFSRKTRPSKLAALFVFLPITYARFLWAIVCFPVFILRRQFLQYKVLFKRIFSGNTFPVNIISDIQASN